MIGQILKEYREKQGMTQLQVANKLGLDSMQFISLIEIGKSKVPFRTLGKLFIIYKVKPQEQKSITAALINEYSVRVNTDILNGKLEAKNG